MAKKATRGGNAAPGPAQKVIQDLLSVVIGEDSSREGLLETPDRVVKAWKQWTSGYEAKASTVLKTFADGAEGCGNEIVLVSNIPVFSFCEHHLAMIWGLAHVGYFPNKKIVGLSKLVRLVEIFSRRLQVQERMTNQIADALTDNLAPAGVGVVLECRHGCMESRGVNVRGTVTTTSALRGTIRQDPMLRAEFLQLVTNASSTKNGL